MVERDKGRGKDEVAKKVENVVDCEYCEKAGICGRELAGATALAGAAAIWYISKKEKK